MAAGTQSVGSLVIDLRANVAQLRADMDEVKSTIAKSSREMSSQMKQDMNETRQVLALMRDDFGVGVPRELRKVIASSELARDAILGIKDALFGLAFLNLGIEAFTKIKEFADGMEKADEAVLKEIKAENDLRTSIEAANKAHDERLRLLGLIGKSADDRYKSDKEHMETLIHLQSQDLIQLGEKAGFQELFLRQAAQEKAYLAGQSGNDNFAADVLQKELAKIAAITLPIHQAIAASQKQLVEFEDSYASLKANHSEEERQDNKKTADEQQKALDAALVKLGEYRTKSLETLDPLTKVTAEWGLIRDTQAKIITDHDTWQVRLAATGTLASQIAATHKIISELDKEIAASMHTVTTELDKQMKSQGMTPIAGLIQGVASGGTPKLNPDMKGAAVDRFAGNFKDAAEQGKLLTKVMDDLLTPTDKFRIMQEELELLKEKYKDYPDVIRALNTEMLKANPEFQKLVAASTQFGQDFTNELDNLITKGESFHDFLTNIAKDIEQIALKALLLKPLEDLFSGTGGSSGGGGITGLLGKLFSGLGFADGGSPPTGQLSLVGENGPELFMPNSAGTIIPNGAMGGVNNTFYIDAKGAAPGSEAAIVRGLQKALEQNRRQSVASAIDYQRRR
jgi:hypothetical protein